MRECDMPIGNSDRKRVGMSPAVHMYRTIQLVLDPVNQFAAASKRVFPPVLAIVN